LNRTIKNTFLIFWATAVLFICIGSLVNFHQHKIWGKALLPQLLYTKRDKEKSLDIFKTVNPGISTVPVHFNIIDFAEIQDQPSTSISFSSKYLIEGILSVDDQQRLSSLPLRAPPLA
jgi:hypothetical protein